MLRQLGEMIRRAAGEDAAVNGRMQSLDAAAEELREAGEGLGRRNRQAGVGELACAAPAGDQLYAGVMQFTGQRGEAALVGNGYQCAGCHVDAPNKTNRFSKNK